MGDKYWITGVQLGMLIALAKNEEVQNLLGKVADNQYLCEKEEPNNLKYKESKKIMEVIKQKVDKATPKELEEALEYINKQLTKRNQNERKGIIGEW